MTLSKKTTFSISLILVGLVFGLLVVWAYSMSGGKTAVTLFFLGLAILSVVTGTILAFSRLLDKVATPVMEEISEDLKDDIEDLKKHRMTNTIWMVALVVTGLLIFSYFVLRFHKMEAMWGFIPVIIPTVIGLVLLAWFIPRTRWFKESNMYTPFWIFLIPTVGFIITLGVGLARTENMSILSRSTGEILQYNTIRTVGPILQETSGIDGIGLELDLPKCDGDECGVLLVIGLIILVFVLIIGSATIPHFWLLSGSIMLGIMILIAVHDLRLRPGAIEYRRDNSPSRSDMDLPDTKKIDENVSKD